MAHLALHMDSRLYLHFIGCKPQGQDTSVHQSHHHDVACGLWHGASLNFVAWGGMHGVALAAHKFSTEMLHRDQITEQSKGIFKWLGILVTFHFVCFTWIFFRNSTFSGSWLMFASNGYQFPPRPVRSGDDGLQMGAAHHGGDVCLTFYPRQVAAGI